jgi:hypothetical protein
MYTTTWRRSFKGPRSRSTRPKFELLHVNQIGEATLASPALVDGRWYVRTGRSLVAIGR